MIKYDSDNTISYLLGESICKKLNITADSFDIFAGGSQLATSVLDYEPTDKCYIWGSGYLRNPNLYSQPRLTRILENKEVLAVRGKLSKEWLNKVTDNKYSDVTVADIYLLTSLLFTRQDLQGSDLIIQNDSKLLISDSREEPELTQKYADKGFEIVSTNNITVVEFLKKLITASEVVTTSAAVLAAAHSYGIKAGYLRTEPFKKNDKLFKLEDYYSQFEKTRLSIAHDLEEVQVSLPSEDEIKEIQIKGLEALKDELVTEKVTELLNKLKGIETPEEPKEPTPEELGQQLEEAVTEGGTITLTGDTVLSDNNLVVTKPATIDLNGYTLSTKGDEKGNVVVFSQINDQDNEKVVVTLKNGTIKASEISSSSAGVVYVSRPIDLTLEDVLIDSNYTNPIQVNHKDAHITINSGSYTSAGSQVVYVQNAEKVEITGGTFDTDFIYNDKYYTINLSDSLVKDTGKQPIDYVTITGGSFVHFNPAESYAEPNAPVSFVPEGYKVVQTGNTFTVLKDNSKELGEQLKEDIKKGGEIKLTDDTFVTETELNIVEDTVLDLGGHTLITDGNEKGCAVVISQDKTVTIKNGTIKGSPVVDEKEGGILYITGAANVTLDNVTIDGGKEADPVWIANDNAEVTINSGTYITNGVESVYMQMGKKVYIKGGYFECQPYKDTYYTVNLKDSLVKDTDKKPLDYVEITGGTFKNFDPSKSMAEPNGPVTLVPENYVVVADEENNTFTVQGTAKSRGVKLLEDISKKSKVKLEDDTSIPGYTITLTQDTTIDLNNHELTSDIDSYGDVLWFKSTKAVKLTLKNGTIKVGEVGDSGGGAIYVTGNIDLTLENIEMDIETGLNPVYLNNANAKLTVKSGKYVTQGVQSVYVQKGDEITIEGGYFECQPALEKYFTLNLKDDLVTEEKQPSDYFKVKGGQFKNFDPSATYAEPKGPHNLVVEGYKVVQKDDDIYEVVPNAE